VGATPRPLAGLKVIAVEQYGAAPFGSLHLAQLGAEVIKIENPDGGDVSHSRPALHPGSTRRGGSFRRSTSASAAALDLRGRGQAVLERLAGSDG
jgi:crotonobetainyl-CoA:carnitine CoA-transferase CaiB-like acyl-CoA transferase